MYNFIKLTRTIDGNAVFINPDSIESFSEGPWEGTRFHTISGGAIDVKESPETVDKIIREIGMIFIDNPTLGVSENEQEL